MATQTFDKLGTKASNVADALTDKLLAPLLETLSTFEGVFPGISKRIRAAIDPEKIKGALSADVATSIQELMEKGTEESLLAAIKQVRELRGLLEQSTTEGIKTLVTEAGGIFIGKDELVKLGKLSADAQIPEIPAEYNQAFLEAAHPLRGCTIASHCILAFDPESNQWHCLDRGEGGISDIIPGSLGSDGRGLSGDKQDKLLQKNGVQIEVEGVEISSLKDSYPAQRILDSAIAMHLAEGKSIESAPFRGIWGRTADIDRANAGCRVLLGSSLGSGSGVHADYRSDDASNLVGLFGAWNKKLDR